MGIIKPRFPKWGVTRRSCDCCTGDVPFVGAYFSHGPALRRNWGVLATFAVEGSWNGDNPATYSPPTIFDFPGADYYHSPIFNGGLFTFNWFLDFPAGGDDTTITRLNPADGIKVTVELHNVAPGEEFMGYVNEPQVILEPFDYGCLGFANVTVHFSTAIQIDTPVGSARFEAFDFGPGGYSALDNGLGFGSVFRQTEGEPLRIRLASGGQRFESFGDEGNDACKTFLDKPTAISIGHLFNHYSGFSISSRQGNYLGIKTIGEQTYTTACSYSAVEAIGEDDYYKCNCSIGNSATFSSDDKLNNPTIIDGVVIGYSTSARLLEGVPDDPFGLRFFDFADSQEIPQACEDYYGDFMMFRNMNGSISNIPLNGFCGGGNLLWSSRSFGLWAFLGILGDNLEPIYDVPESEFFGDFGLKARPGFISFNARGPDANGDRWISSMFGTMKFQIQVRGSVGFPFWCGRGGGGIVLTPAPFQSGGVNAKPTGFKYMYVPGDFDNRNFPLGSCTGHCEGCDSRSASMVVS